MKILRVATSFAKYAQNDLLLKAQLILLCLTGNPNFETPVPTLKVFSDAIDAYAATLANVTSRTNTAAKKAARAALMALLNQLAMYVQMNSNNDVAVMLTSGFSLTKTPQPIGVLPKPENFKVLPLYNGSVKLSLKKITGADSYRFEYAAAPSSKESAWVTVLSTKANTTISGLSSGNKYAFRVTGIGSNPASVYSDEIVSYIL